MSRRTGTFVFLAALLLTASVRAHHNMSAAFDFSDRVSLTGTLTKVDWRNPHIYLLLDVKQGDQVEPWSIEGPSPRAGQNKADASCCRARATRGSASPTTPNSSTRCARAVSRSSPAVRRTTSTRRPNASST